MDSTADRGKLECVGEVIGHHLSHAVLVTHQPQGLVHLRSRVCLDIEGVEDGEVKVA